MFDKIWSTLNKPISFRDCLGYFSLCCSVIGATLVASNTEYTKYGYVLFLLGGASSMRLMWNSNVHHTVFITQMYFICVDIIGIINFSRK